MSKNESIIIILVAVIGTLLLGPALLGDPQGWLG